MRTALFVPVAALFVLGGTVSTISSKWADLLVVPTPNNPNATFVHPFMQTWLMFLGEFSCMWLFYGWLAYKKVKGQEIIPGEHRALPVLPLIYLIPACCDFTASTTMFIGLNLTQASVYQMLRGATVLFTAVLSRILLKRTFQVYQWFGMFLVIVGLICVGLTSIIGANAAGGANTAEGKAMIGNVLIVVAQLVASIQMVIEERILGKYKTHPFELVGWEGFFGMSITTIVVVVFMAFPNRPDDIVEFFYQLSQSGNAVLATILMTVSIPVLNATGQTITKNISATTRMVFDTIRNIFVWIFTLILGSYFGETFQWLQLVGFILLVAGTSIYKHLLKLPIGICQHVETESEEAERKRLTGDDGAPATTVAVPPSEATANELRDERA